MAENHIAHLVKHFNEFHYGKNWTWSNLKDVIDDVTYEEATAQIASLNTIVKLTYHIHYYFKVTIPVLQGGDLDAHDKFSFAHPAIDDEESWKNLKKKIFATADTFMQELSKMDERQLWTTFSEEKYGDYYRNLYGTLEHSHYHLGQIVVIKKLLRSDYPKV